MRARGRCGGFKSHELLVDPLNYRALSVKCALTEKVDHLLRSAGAATATTAASASGPFMPVPVLWEPRAKRDDALPFKWAPITFCQALLTVVWEREKHNSTSQRSMHFDSGDYL